MSDDLISRKEAIDILENMIFEVGKDLSKSYLLQAARERIIGLNTAFDKEKVINEIHVSAARVTVNMNVSSSYAEGYIDAAKDIIEIVKRDGLI